MPEISLLEPLVLRGVVEKLTAPETLILLNRIPQTPWPFPSATWDVVRGSRMVAKPNVPNSEAHIVPRLGRSQESASFIYLREKKVFEPTTLRWLRQPGELAAKNAEASVLREIADLNVRFDNFAEICLWGALKGRLTLDYPDVVADVDYKMPASHGVTPSVPWSVATPTQIVADVRAWKRLVEVDGRVPAREVYATAPTIELIFDAFATTRLTTVGGTTTGTNGFLLSDRMKDQYWSTGSFDGFLGLTWHTVQSQYELDSGTPEQFIPDYALFLGNYTDNRPIELFIGPSADDEAPTDYTGKFAKTWKDKDPSARQYLLEWSLMPVVTRPEQLVYCANVNPVLA